MQLFSTWFQFIHISVILRYSTETNLSFSSLAGVFKLQWPCAHREKNSFLSKWILNKIHQVTLLRKQTSRFILPTKYQLMISKLRHWSASTSVYFFGHFKNFRCMKSSTEKHSKWCNFSSFLSTIKSGDKIWVLLSSSGRFTQHLFAINSDLNVNSYSFFSCEHTSGSDLTNAFCCMFTSVCTARRSFTSRWKKEFIVEHLSLKPVSSPTHESRQKITMGKQN